MKMTGIRAAYAALAIAASAAFALHSFAAVPVSAVADPTWPDWLMQRLAPDHRVPEQRAPDQRAPDHRVSERSAPETGRRAAAAATGLRAPTADDAWLAFAGEKPRAGCAIEAERADAMRVPEGNANTRDVELVVYNIKDATDALASADLTYLLRIYQWVPERRQ